MGRMREKKRTETTVKVHTIENKEHICLNSTSLKMFAGRVFFLFIPLSISFFFFFSIWLGVVFFPAIKRREREKERGGACARPSRIAYSMIRFHLHC